MTNNRDSVPSIADRVSAGINLLDREVPDWDRRVNVDTLRLSSCERCVLGQLYGTWGDGLDELDLWDGDDEGAADSAALGFSLYEGEAGRYGELTDAWVAAIRDRRAVAR
jgi:hypothetical protein